MRCVGWADYLARYHREHPGITETALNDARHPVHGTAHQWLAAARLHSVAGRPKVAVLMAAAAAVWKSSTDPPS